MKNGPTLRRDIQLSSTAHYGHRDSAFFFRRPQACRGSSPLLPRTAGADVHNRYPHSFHKTFLQTYEKAIIKGITLSIGKIISGCAFFTKTSAKSERKVTETWVLSQIMPFTVSH